MSGGMRNVEDILPLSPMQELMLAGTVAATDGGSLVNQVRYEIRGPLDPAIFRQAWEELATRHAALRTAVLWEGLERPVQVVRSRVEVAFAEHDLSPLSVEDRTARLDAIIGSDAGVPFVLRSAPLFRCTLIRMDRDTHVFLWSVHHLVIDRWSHGTLFSELRTIYEALMRGEEHGLEPAPSFREYIAWLSRQSDSEGERFWAKELRGFREPTTLVEGIGRSSTEVSVDRVTTRQVLSDSVLLRLQERAAAWRSTLASLLLAAVGVTLARRSRRADVLFGLTVSGRPPDLPGVERSVGSFINNVPVRVRWDRAGGLRDEVADLQRRQVERGRFEYVSPAAIRDAAELSPGTPLFDILVVLNLDEQEEPAWAGLEVRGVGAAFDAAHPLVLGVDVDAGSLRLTLVHPEPVDGAALLDEVAEALDALAEADDEMLVGHMLPECTGLDARDDLSIADDEGGTSGELEGTGPPEPEPADIPKAVARAWREVLGVDHADPEQDFFDLGGTSLQAVRILHALERMTGRSLGISALFEARTLGGLIEHLGGEALPVASERRGIPVADRTTPVRLSFAQERLWALDQIEAAPSVYNLSFAYRLVGQVNPEHLRRSIDYIVQRHEVLRTAYAMGDDGPVHTVSESSDGAWAWSARLDEASEEAVGRHLEAEAAKPFDLQSGRLLRASLHRIAPRDHVLLFVTHHSVSDAWSVGVLERDLAAVYASVLSDSEPALPPLPIQYADFAAWQRGRLSGDALEDDLAYWCDHLADVRPLDLPTDRPRPSVQSFRGAIRRVSLDEELTDSLKALARDEGTTLFSVLMAAFHLLLYRYSSQDDIAVGTPFSGRTRAGLDGLIGMFVNTVVFRTRPDPGRTFRDLLTEVREASTAAHRHQEVPFERLVQALQPERNLSRNPIFQAMFALQDRRDGQLELAGLETRSFPLSQDTSKFDLTLYLQEALEGSETGGVEGIWEYATDLFDASTVRRMHGHFVNLLSSIVADPSGPLTGLPMASDAERGALIGGAGDATVDPEPLFLERFRVQAERAPDRVAVTHGAVETTYAELERRSNRLAHRLIEVGAGAERPIGICLHRSADLVVALLAVLKSGASYVPLDPDYPAERLRYMLADTEASILVTSRNLRSRLPSFGGEIVLMDDLDSDPAPETAPAVVVEPDQLAYTIYTSGSTGRPKGVDVNHGNLAHFTAAMLDRPGLTAEDVILAKTTVAFDPSVVELLTTLVVGARMVIVDASEVTTGRRLSQAIEASGATLLQATPATFHMLFEAGWKGRPGLRVLVGGEALTVELARRLVESCGEVWNIYGPTEGTVWSSCWRVPDKVGPVRIGTPMGDTRLLVLDDRLEPTPTGVLGELFVGGAGVTRGYRNLANVTDASYVSNPFSKIPGDRLYRTGDIARVLDDGSLESFGRRDSQVQLRGFRIELAEIEAVLAEHDDIRRAVVTVVDAGTPDARLVAYIIFAYAAALTVSEVRSYLRERLPDYMVPGLVVELDEFPLTPSGKIDRRELPDPIARAASSTPVFTPPSSDRERLLAKVWMELLDLDQVGLEDNFFQLGGHSLLALRAVSAFAERGGGSIEPRAMFFQTLGQLAGPLGDA